MLQARASQLPRIMEVLSAAKKIMRSSGNLNQWIGGYPSEEAILGDIEKGCGYAVEDEGNVVGYFAFVPSPEPTYKSIYEGKWVDDTLPYHVIHRIGSFPEVHGVFKSIMDWCFCQDPNIRIDTHRDNKIMQHLILKEGFTYCGIIYLENGDERLAYQKIL
ncbi:MAG: N-acetyltransferase [Bacteroidales bacterium]|nr:N-acetyltransferase [Bacteroidales bacterium]